MTYTFFDPSLLTSYCHRLTVIITPLVSLPTLVPCLSLFALRVALPRTPDPTMPPFLLHPSPTSGAWLPTVSSDVLLQNFDLLEHLKPIPCLEAHALTKRKQPFSSKLLLWIILLVPSFNPHHVLLIVSNNFLYNIHHTSIEVFCHAPPNGTHFVRSIGVFTLILLHD